MSTEYISIGLDELQKSAKELYAEYRLLEDKLKKEIGARVLREAGQIFLDEQKRILLSRYPNSKIAPLLKVWITEEKYGWRLRVGVPNAVTKEEAIFVMEQEFGRPGKRSHGVDKNGHKIGKVEPFSYVRASKFLKGEEVEKKVVQLLDEELKRAWKPGNAGF